MIHLSLMTALLCCNLVGAVAATPAVRQESYQERAADFKKELKVDKDRARGMIHGLLREYQNREKKLARLRERLEREPEAAKATAKEIRIVEKQQLEITKAIALPLRSSQCKKPSVENVGLWTSAVDALEQMGEAAGEVLLDAQEDPRFKRHPELRRRMLAGVGRSGAFSKVDGLIRMLGADDPELVYGAMVGLGWFKSAPGKLRKEAVAALVEDYEEREIKTGYHPDPQRRGEAQADQARWANYEPLMKAALHQLTGVDFADSDSAKEWFRKYRKDDELWKDE